MEKIAIIIREIPYLKLLAPIMDEFINIGVGYNLYYMDSPKGDKEYVRPNIERINLSGKQYIEKSLKSTAFANDEQLKKILKDDKITKLVSVEIWLWARKYIKFLKQNNIKTYSILYLTDSLWHPKENILSMDKIFYGSAHIMNCALDFAGVKYDKFRDICVGSPLFDCINNKPSSGNDILVLLPNLKEEHVAKAFGSKQNFFKIIDKLCSNNKYKYIFKTRQKQWLPEQIKKYASEIITDDQKMYPTTVSSILERTFCTIMFYSSGIYECVYGGNHVVNIPLNLDRWSWDVSKMNRYLSASKLYNFEGVVSSIDKDLILLDSFHFSPNRVDPLKMTEWVNKFIGNNMLNITESIVKEIIH